MSEEIRTKIEEIITGIKGRVDFDKGERLQNDLGMDSLDMITFFFDLEKAFSIPVKEEDIGQYQLTIMTNVVNYVASRAQR
ncbi:MAG: phosphopantetheine-binding protein [Thermodesulfobacteriota bacterium]